jgi:hypothetical protein
MFQILDGQLQGEANLRRLSFSASRLMRVLPFSRMVLHGMDADTDSHPLRFPSALFPQPSRNARPCATRRRLMTVSVRLPVVEQQRTDWLAWQTPRRAWHESTIPLGGLAPPASHHTGELKTPAMP